MSLRITAASAGRIAALSLLFACTTLPSLAQGTKFWNQSHFEEFEKGRPAGVAIASDGHLEAGPTVKQIATTPSTYIWSAAADSHGNAYAGTGSPATVLRIGADGQITKMFETKDLNVQVVRVDPDGAIYAATMPSGKVYRLAATATGINAAQATVVFDPAKVDGAPKYIWDLQFDSEGRLYVATGGPAAIYRVLTSGGDARPELFFKSDEQHIRSMLFEKGGSLLAGSDGDGLLYRIGKDGKSVILWNAPKREITALAESPAGLVYAAAVGEKGKSSLPPIPVQGITSVTATITIVAPGSVQASNTNSLIPDGSEVYELNREGAPRRLWAAHDDVVYALHATPTGLLAATGNRGRVYRVREDGQYADVAHLEAGQVTAMAPVANGDFYLGTSNSGKLYRLDETIAPDATFQSDTFDAGVFSRWGRPEVDASNASYELWARSGNVSNPERGWSPWQKVAPASATLPIPSARFVQWKVSLQPKVRLNAVGINYLPVNVAPVVDEIVVQTGARVNQQAMQPQPVQPITINLPSVSANSINLTQDQATGPLQALKDKSAVTARWAAHDDNGDELTFAVYYRSASERNWQLLKDNVGDRFLTWDAAQLPDGAYRLKVVASDAPSHNPGDAMTGERESDRFVVDTTSPAVGPLTARMENGKVHVTGDVKDAASPITHAEYSIDAGPWQYIEPVGKLSDSLSERYDFSATIPAPPPNARVEKLPPADPAEHVVTLRVYDRYENVASSKTTVQ
ncbi:MAG: hypothetical protein ACR2JE_02470 [Acidobacteriaceae bacterium]